MQSELVTDDQKDDSTINDISTCKDQKVITKEFPTIQAQPTIAKITDNTMIYCTRYELDMDDFTGIFEYDIDKNSSKLIKTWQSINYFPRFNATIFSHERNTFYSVGGIDVKNDNKDLDVILSVNLSTMKSQIIATDLAVGRNSRLLLTDDENILHITAGLTDNKTQKHIKFDLTTNTATDVHDFSSTNPNLSEHGIVYSKSREKLFMFGGINLHDPIQDSINRYNGISLFDDFWICDIKPTQKMEEQTKLIISAWYESKFGIIPKEVIDIILSFDGYNWYKYDQYKLPAAIRGFGYVIYDDRIIITFGGIGRQRYLNDIYYLDLNSKNGWETSTFQLQVAGMYNALLIDGDTVHLFPFYSGHNTYYILKVSHVLPKSLI